MAYLTVACRKGPCYVMLLAKLQVCLCALHQCSLSRIFVMCPGGGGGGGVSASEATGLKL